MRDYTRRDRSRNEIRHVPKLTTVNPNGEIVAPAKSSVRSDTVLWPPKESETEKSKNSQCVTVMSGWPSTAVWLVSLRKRDGISPSIIHAGSVHSQSSQGLLNPQSTYWDEGIHNPWLPSLKYPGKCSNKKLSCCMLNKYMYAVTKVSQSNRRTI